MFGSKIDSSNNPYRAKYPAKTLIHGNINVYHQEWNHCQVVFEVKKNVTPWHLQLIIIILLVAGVLGLLIR